MYFVITNIINKLFCTYRNLSNVFIYLVTYRPIGPGAFCVFVYVIVYTYVNVCTSHNNKPFTYLLIQRYRKEFKRILPAALSKHLIKRHISRHTKKVVI